MLLTLFTTACSTPFPVQDGAALIDLSVEPAEIELVTGPDGGAAQQFEATATFSDGSVITLSEAEWSLSNRSSGEVDETGRFQPSTDNGGVTWVTAKYAGASASATATITYIEERIEGGVDPGLFDSTATGGATLWRYPEDGVNLPRNTPSIRFEWDPDAGQGDTGAAEVTAARLRFQSEITDLTVYTADSTWTADEQTWQVIGSTNAGGEVVVDLAVALSDGDIIESTPIKVFINRMDASGSIFYWSSSASGFKEIPYGGEAQDFLTPALASYEPATEEGWVTQCYGCHAISSQGHMAFTYDGGNGRLGVKTIDGLTDVIAYADDEYMNFKTYSPGGEHLLATYQGGLFLYDGATGAYLNQVAIDGTATHVNWSPDGTAVALVMTEGHSADWFFSGGKIAIMDHLGGGVFDEPRVIYAPASGYNAYYPAWSPDNAWVAFNISTGDAYDDYDAEVYVTTPDGATVVRLDAANQTEGLTNSWPMWGPLPDDDVLWLTFASKRDYGTVATGRPQIWVAAFDPELAAAGQDPSWPAFWLPGQSSDQSNHLPVWVSR